MASPPFQMEDQTDEDFFDKLVDDDDDEIDYTRSVPSFVDGNDSDEVKAFANLNIGEVGTVGVDSGGDIGFGNDGEKGFWDGAASASVDAPENNLVANESITSTASNVVECIDDPIRSDGATGNLTSAAGVKEVDWSSFNPDSHFQSGSGFGSYSDFFSEVGDNSGDPFSTVADTGSFGAVLKSTDGVLETPVTELSSVQHQDGQFYETGNVQAVDGQDLNSNQYWENLYPGWRYDPNTGQWLQLDGLTADANTNVNALSATDVIPEQKSDIYYLQQTTQSVLGSIAEESTTGTVSNWNQVSPENAEYPAHMVFDPQYPGWYYDTIAQEWRLLESYTTVNNQPTSVDHYQQNQNANVSTGGNVLQNNYSSYGSSEQFGNYQSHGLSSQDQVVDQAASMNNYNHKNMTMWQPEPVPKSEAINFPVNQQFGNVYGSKGNEHSSTYHQTGFKPSGENAIYGQATQGFDNSNPVVGFQSFAPAENFLQQSSHSQMEPTQQMNVSPAYFERKEPASFLQQPLQSFTQFSHASSEGRSSAGRPPHALVTFGFGGKLVVMRDNSSMLTNSAYSTQESAGGVVNVFNLAEVVMDKIDASSIGLGACDYFQSLCQRSFPGPLAGGSVGSRELNKWIDDKIAIGDYSDKDYRKGEISKMLFSLLKIACQNYGKLRSPLGSDQALKDNNCPESAVVKLFASDRKNGAPVSEYGAHTCCLQNLPPEAHSQATALDVQKLLVSGRKKEALECAQQGQLWGPALVLAYELGGQFFADTVKQMALHQLVAGSPLRTLCLLIAGQPTDVFSNSTSHSDMSSAFNILQQPVQIGPNYVLDEWEENLAIITANRTKDDELVIIHLGDCLWKERGEVTAAHICYLVAEANFESYSDSARLCLIGADHWKFPRTYTSPEAIQRTELYEYSKVLGNPQFILLPFQPYKLIYAYMLAEVGKLSDSLKYCQAIAKSLKTGRTPEVDTWKQLVSSLEERIRTHQQGGYSTNLAPTKLVGKLLNFFDNTAHRVVGGLPPPIPSPSHSKVQYNEPIHQQGGPRVSNSQSTMAMSTLMPSASMEPISEWTGEGNRTAIPNRSISEPDFGKTPRKVDSSKEEKTSVSGGSSRFGRFGSQLLQKTVGLVLRSRPDKQAKLGEKNRFYYDEKLKRWVEEGAEPPAEEAALPPPPTTAAFQNGVPGQNGINFPNEKLGTNGGPEIKTPLTSEQSPGIPPMPPSSNQFSARGRMGVRARYVDTFNKGGGTPANLFQSPSMPAAKSGGGYNPKFFVPPPAVSSEETRQTTGESIQEAVATNENPSTSYNDDSFSSPPSSRSSSVSMQRFPSMDNIVQKRMGAMANAQRAASWSGSLCDANNPSKMTERKPLREVLGMPPSPFMPSNSPSMHVSTSKNSSTEDLHEVEL